MKTLRKRSAVPYIAVGAVFLAYGWFWAISSVWDYIALAMLSSVAFRVARKRCPDEVIQIEAPAATGDAECDKLLSDAYAMLGDIRRANDVIADPLLSNHIDQIEQTCRVILKRLEEQPALQPQLRTFLRYYLPTTCKLLSTRAELEPTRNESENARKTRYRTERILMQVEDAFTKQLEALDKHRYLDIQVEMDVLEGMLKSDGLAGDLKGAK